MELLNSKHRVRVVPNDRIGEENWAKALGGLHGTFEVVSQSDLEVVRVRARKSACIVEVPIAIVRKV